MRTEVDMAIADIHDRIAKVQGGVDILKQGLANRDMVIATIIMNLRRRDHDVFAILKWFDEEGKPLLGVGRAE